MFISLSNNSQCLLIALVHAPLWASQVAHMWFDPQVGKIPSGRKWQPTPVFLPGKSHGQRSLVNYSLWGCKESNMSQQPNMNSGTHYQLIVEQRSSHH